MQALRASYEARLQALEARLQAAERAAAATTAAAPTAATAPATPTTAPAPHGAAAPARGTAGGNANSFNPAISLILSGLYTRTSQRPGATTRSPASRCRADAEIGPGTRGFSLANPSSASSASIDPWWRGAASIALTPTTRLGRGSLSCRPPRSATASR